MKKLLLLGASLLTLAVTPPAARALPPDVVVVRSLEMLGSIIVSVARSGRKEELVEFENGYTTGSLKKASAGYQKLIQQLYQEGYALQSSFATGHATDGWVTLIFVKP
ncbi:hypothetical protein LJ737_19285 [Hymenobacter sp. 15J16-1T3B]|uniref:hypothetical protein n=1 Tax=Hymenobacter sp. 15J16-1T3B TaxID=2886941 RepID=UPI001D0FE183|nr:hypothetical protein [Hymenobacter sp. 15J16-1T3B]MCC3159394.1 hypothetical protein [Hymenobacter sp. 15J16-1T3B]